jgi:hypothetical protein
METLRIKKAVYLASALMAFAQTSAAQQPILSPRDSVELRFNGKRIFIDYGRPSMRGRRIFGGLVRYNQWWRTGANEATSFITELDLIMGGSLVPKGAYTLYTLPSETQWKIMINRETGQWGTVYNPEYDLVRLPMKKSKLKNPVEQLTISLEKTGLSSGILKISWETTEVSIDFRVRNTNGKKNSR